MNRAASALDLLELGGDVREIARVATFRDELLERGLSCTTGQELTLEERAVLDAAAEKRRKKLAKRAR